MRVCARACAHACVLLAEPPAGALLCARLSMTPEEHKAFWRDVQFTVDKDVVRTDRSNQFFRGEDNPNVESMRYLPSPASEGLPEGRRALPPPPFHFLTCHSGSPYPSGLRRPSGKKRNSSRGGVQKQRLISYFRQHQSTSCGWSLPRVPAKPPIPGPPPSLACLAPTSPG